MTIELNDKELQLLCDLINNATIPAPLAPVMVQIIDKIKNAGK